MWLLLSAAIAVEVTATISLKMATTSPIWYGPVFVGYAASFVLLSLILRAGAPIGVIYGIWSACGIALTAVLAAAIFDDPLNPLIGLGIVLVIAGVALIEVGSTGTTDTKSTNAGVGA